MRIRLSQRDQQILETLATKLRLLSQGQISRHWFAADTANARRRLKQLAEFGLVERITVRARPLPNLDRPIISWRPGQTTPDFGKASYACRVRWRPLPVQTMVAYVATEFAASQFGGVRRHGITKHFQVTHDLGVSEMWLMLSRQSPRWADAWRGEDVMAATRYRQKLPDAFIVDANEKVVCAQEFGGTYSRERIRDFHLDNQARNLSYQLW
ncbi:MAG: hypothetical protein KDA87_00615 [Planctomycetales bacterium]|nr:hypothetical protein [Planctomycetales bacterium]